MRIRAFVAAALLGSSLGCTSTPRPAVEITKVVAKDHVIHTEGASQAERLLQQLQPAVDEARRTYPEARKRYLAGLPEGSHFFVTTRVQDSRGVVEQIFVLVDGFKGLVADGRVWSEIVGVGGFEQGQVIHVAEADVIDWTILDAEGREEGNFVGKLLDALQGISH